MNNHKDYLIWIDLEMTGLNPDIDKILEIATIITDTDLNIIEEGPVFAIYQNEDALNRMDDWNVDHHGRSGLIQRVRKSTISESMAEVKTLHFIKKYVKAKKSPLCGNSICQDRRFLFRHMPTLENYFHYRHLDVSTIKVLAGYWKPEIVKNFTKQSQHIALEDIKDSIEELRHYRRHFFKDWDFL